jgi:hypothetical protein
MDSHHDEARTGTLEPTVLDRALSWSRVDYAKLTIIGVVIACLAWPVATPLSSAPRWLFLRLAILVTAVLLLPDAWLLARGSPPKAVAVLVVMHLAIAVITYNCLVHLAPVRRLRRRGLDRMTRAGRLA